MYKKIDQEFIIRTLKNYDERTRNLRKEMSAQYKFLNSQELDEDVLQAVAYPVYDTEKSCGYRDGDIDEIYSRYVDLSKQRIDDIKSLMRDITEEQESMNRIMAIYDTLDALGKDILSCFYVNNKNQTIYEVAFDVAKKHDLSVQSIWRLRKKAIEHLINLYNSDLTQAEILHIRAQDKVRLTNKEKYR